MSVGIALSAPAILSQHEYIESLLEKENMRKKTEQRASSASRARRRENLAARFPSLERKNKSNDSLSRKTVSSSATTIVPLNLPEFENFQSDHLLLAAHLFPNTHHDRSRCSSALSTSTKFHRTSTSNNNNNNNNVNQQTSSPKIVTSSNVNNNIHSPRSNYATSKRLSRSRQTHDTTINHASFSSSSSSQQAQSQTQIVRPISLRQMTTKLDAIGCFREVRKIFDLLLFLLLNLSLVQDDTQHSLPEGRI